MARAAMRILSSLAPAAVGLARHGQIHAYFGAFAVEVCVQVGYHLGVGVLGHSDLVLGDKLEGLIGCEFLEFAFGSAAEGALFGCFVAFVDVAAYCADKFLFHNSLLYYLFGYVSCRVCKDNH